MKNKIVVFYKTGARIYVNRVPRDFKTQGYPYLVNPEFPLRVPPHYWKLSDDKIIEMNEEEKKERDALLEKLAKEKTDSTSSPVQSSLGYFWAGAVGLVIGAALSYGAYLFL